jgi:hypothetical protein
MTARTGIPAFRLHGELQTELTPAASNAKSMSSEQEVR